MDKPSDSLIQAASAADPGQQHAQTSVVYECPCADGDPYYPVPRPQNAALYKLYEAEAEAETDVTFVGRLATYKYDNMDQVVGQSLAAFKRIRQQRLLEQHKEAAVSGPRSMLDVMPRSVVP